MSRENVDAVRGLYVALSRGDPGTLDLVHPEAELHQLPNLPGSASYYGREAFAEAVAAFVAEWEVLRFEPVEVTEADDHVVAHIRAFGRGKASGVAGAREEFHAWTMRDGKPHQCFVRSTRAEALEAVELRG